MIVRISTESQYLFPDDQADRLNDLDNAVVAAVAAEDEDSFHEAFEEMLSLVRAEGKPLYWIYNYKRGAFYPFVPSGGEQQRDSERELRLQAQIGAELPVEAQLERWFPLWDIPI